jgi:cytochrome c oxidase subunit 2
VWFVPTKTNDEIRKSLTKSYSIAQAKVPSILLHLVAMSDYQGKDGAVLLSKGSPFTEEVIPQLRDAGITEVMAGPDTPMEIACAQLCGLGHYKMRGVVTIQTEDEFKAWLALQASYLEQ